MIMEREPFSGFLSKTGHRVLHCGGVDWYEVARGFVLSLPSHRPLTPPQETLDELFAARGIYGARFPSPLDGLGKLSYQIVCDDPEYSLQNMSSNTRSKVRRGLRRCEVRPVAFDELARLGQQADRDTMVRQGREPRLLGERWDEYWRCAAETEGMEGWAAFVGDELAAFLVTVGFSDGPVEYLLARSRTDMLGSYPNNALIYACTEELLTRRQVAKITFGLESLEAVNRLDDFKFGMGFRAEEVRQRVVFRPALRRILSLQPVRSLLYRWGSERGPEGGFWRKGVGLLRFAEEGGDLA